MFIDTLILGFLTSIVTQSLKKLTNKVGGEYAKIVVFVLIFLVVAIVGFIMKIAPVEYVQYIVASYAMSVAVYETILKKILPVK